MNWECVLDASVALTSIASGEHGYARKVVDVLEFRPAMVPSLWWLEITNSLLVAEQKASFSTAASDVFLAGFARLRITTEPAVSNAGAARIVYELARDRQISTYDATYLDLAHRFQLPIATLDRRLRDAALAEGVVVYDPPPSLHP